METIPIWEDYNFDAETFDPQTKLFDESKLIKDGKIRKEGSKKTGGYVITGE